MKFSLSHKAVTFVLVASAAAPLIFSGEIGLGFILAFVVLSATGWILEPPLTRDKRYRQAISALVLIVLAVQLVRFTNGEPMAKLGMEFASVLLGVKMCSRGFATDYHQIIILAFLHIIAATVAIDDISYGASFLVFVALSPSVLALSYLRKEMEHRFGEDAGEDGPRMLERLLGSKRIVSLGFLAGSSLLSLPVLIITGFIFITFPRIGFGLLGRLSKNESMAGFGNEITLNDFDLIHQDNTVVIRLEPIGPHRERLGLLPVKLRGAVFDQYKDNRWKRKEEGPWQKLVPRGNDYVFDNSYMILPQTPGFEMFLESIEPPLLFIPEGTGQIKTYPVASGGRVGPRVLEQDRLGTIRYKDDAQVGLRYRVYLTGIPPYGSPPSREVDYLQLPKNSDRLATLARRFAGNGPKRQQISGLISELRKNYRYSAKLSQSRANGFEENPLDRFLFSRRAGTCTHFATALTLMLRAIEIPARIATGFSSADWNPIGGYYAVHKRSAHSWTEVFLDGRWISLDATPESSTPRAPFHASTLAMFVDTLRMNWHKHVVSYNAASQFRLAMGLRNIWYRTFRPKRGFLRISIWPLPAILGGAMGVGFVIWLRRKRRRTPLDPPARSLKQHDKEATKLYLYLERKLVRLGYIRPLSITPTEHLQTLRRASPPLAGVVEQVTDRYNEVRFGNGVFGPDEAKSLKIKIRKMVRS